jgi:enoyl-CoA hydratase/carnithine racemase
VLTLSFNIPRFSAEVSYIYFMFTVADLGRGHPAPDPARQSLSTHHHLKNFQHVIGAPERCNFPVITAVHGFVVGLGIDIISACDVR